MSHPILPHGTYGTECNATDEGYITDAVYTVE